MRPLYLFTFLMLGAAASAQPLAEAPPASPAASLLIVHESVAVDDLPDEVQEQIETGTRFGIGVGGTFLAYGLSGTLDVTDTITAEAVLGFVGSFTSLGGRLWYRFNQNEAYDVYGYASVSYLNYDVSLFSEDAIGIGGGVGIEASLPQLFDSEDFPPIFINLDVGIGFATFDVYDGFSAFAGGSGIHYRF